MRLRLSRANWTDQRGDHPGRAALTALASQTYSNFGLTHSDLYRDDAAVGGTLSLFDSVRTQPAEDLSASASGAHPFESAATVQAQLAAFDYVADDSLSVSVFLAARLG